MYIQKLQKLGYKKNIEFFNIIVIETIIYQFNNIINIGIEYKEYPWF